MNSRLAFRSAVLAAALSLLLGCGAARRVGKDCAVVLTSPVTILAGGVHDGLDWGERAVEPTTPIGLSPVLIPLHMTKHAVYTCLHALDIVWAPFYLLAAINAEYDLQPLEMYSLVDGYPWQSAPFPVFEEDDPPQR